jgi:putative chitinase
MTFEQLRRALPFASANNFGKFYAPLATAMLTYGITTPKRQAAFLAQIAHESGSLAYVREIASGQAYEGRSDLGNVEPGDGVRFKGRGLIQITGRANYNDVSFALGVNFAADPSKLEQPEYAAMSAAWFWHKHGLNGLADRDAFGSITKIINGGFNGLDDRIVSWLSARKAFNI